MPPCAYKSVFPVYIDAAAVRACRDTPSAHGAACDTRTDHGTGTGENHVSVQEAGAERGLQEQGDGSGWMLFRAGSHDVGMRLRMSDLVRVLGDSARCARLSKEAWEMAEKQATGRASDAPELLEDLIDLRTGMIFCFLYCD